MDTNFRRCGANPKRSVEKYMVAVLDGVVFENHYIYVDSYVSNAEKKTQQYIESLDNDIKTPYSYYTLSAIKNYFFLTHTARHFSEYLSITIRHI